MIFVSADECALVLDEAAVLEAVEDALRMEHAGTVRWSTASDLRVQAPAGRIRVKAGSLDAAGVSGVRMLRFPAVGRPVRWVIVFDDATGRPLGIVDETWTYAQRSIASVAFMAHRLRGPEVRRVAILGAGRIARAALWYVVRLFPDADVAVASRRPETRNALARAARDEIGLRAVAATVEDALRDADVVLACTSASSPIVGDASIASGAVVASLEPRECHPSLYDRSDLRVVDSREQLAPELADAFGPEAPDRVDATMAEVVGGVHPGRTHPDQRVLILSQGLMSQDLLLAARALEAAAARGLGARLPMP